MTAESISGIPILVSKHALKKLKKNAQENIRKRVPSTNAKRLKGQRIQHQAQRTWSNENHVSA